MWIWNEFFQGTTVENLNLVLISCTGIIKLLTIISVNIQKLFII